MLGFCARWRVLRGPWLDPWPRAASTNPRGKPRALGAATSGFVREKRQKNPTKIRQQRFTRHVLNLSRKDKLQEAGEVLGAMKRSGVSPEAATFNALIAGHAKRGQAREAFKLFNQMKKRDLPPTQHTYTSMFSACAVARDENILSKVQAEIDRRDVKLNLISSNALISALSHCGRGEEARKEFSDMLSRGIEPDVKTFTCLLQAMSHDKEGGVASAMGVWQEMLASNVNPDLYSFNLLLQCLKGAGLSGLQRQKPHPPLRINFPSEFTSQLVSELREVPVEYSVTVALTSNHSLCVFVTSSGQRLLEDESLDGLSAAMKVGGVKPDVRTFNLLASLTPDTANLIGRMNEACVAVDNQFILTAIKNQCRHGNLEGAKALCRYSRSLGLAVPEGAWSSIAGCCSAQREGVELVEEMKASGVPVGGAVFAVLIKTAARTRGYEYLTALMKEMRHCEVTAGQDIVRILERLLAHPPTDRRQKMRFNGFSGYYHLWKRTLSKD